MWNDVRTRRLVLALGLFLGTTGSASAESPLWCGLKPGPHPIGFRTSWEFDHSRAYNTTFPDKTRYADGKAPRPILINVWYPAASDLGEAMPHRSYLEITSADKRLAKFSHALIDYEHKVIAQEVAGKTDLTPAEKKALDKLLDTPTPCRRDAQPAAGKFPLVLYHAGYGSSFEDNAVLCEYLASHGYVVLGSAYQEPTGATFNIDGKVTSARDFEFLIAHASRMPNVDWQHIGVTGHSGGAHAALMYRAQDGSPVDAVVSLDTTQDYYSPVDRRWGKMVQAVTAGRANFTGPVMAVANPYAFFPLFEQLDKSHRYYLTVRDLGHNDFISQGCVTHAFRAELADAGAAKQAAEAKLKAVRTGYAALNMNVRRFLDAHLKEDKAARDELTRPGPKFGGAEPVVEVVPGGETGPAAFRDDGKSIPTPRQFRPYLREHGAEKAAAMLRRARKDEPTHPLNHSILAFALVYELLEQGKDQDARLIAACAREAEPKFDNLFVAFGDAFGKRDNLWFGISCYKKAVALNPDNAEAVRKLREAEKAAEKK